MVMKTNEEIFEEYCKKEFDFNCYYYSSFGQHIRSTLKYSLYSFRTAFKELIKDIIKGVKN